MSEAAKRQDLRALWDESPELRREVESELFNWGRAYRDSGPNIGYPTQWSFYTPPRDQRDKPMPSQPAPDADLAQRTEDQFVMWRLMAEESPPHIREHLDRMHAIAVMKYVHRERMEEIGKAIGVGKRQTINLKNEMLYRYWVISR